MAAPTGGPSAEDLASNIVVLMSTLADLMSRVLSEGDLDDTSRQRLAGVYRLVSTFTAEFGAPA